MNKSHFFKFLLSALITCPLITFAASEPWTIEDVLEVSSELSQQMRDPEEPHKSLCLRPLSWCLFQCRRLP